MGKAYQSQQETAHHSRSHVLYLPITEVEQCIMCDWYANHALSRKFTDHHA